MRKPNVNKRIFKKHLIHNFKNFLNSFSIRSIKNKNRTFLRPSNRNNLFNFRLKHAKLFFYLFIILFTNCRNEKLEIINKYKKIAKSKHSSIKEKNVYEELYSRSLLNLRNNYPFYIIRVSAPLYLSNPNGFSHLPGNCIELKFGDIVFPIQEKKTTPFFFHVKTINNISGWINSNSGIALDYNEDPELYYFSNKYYLQSYINAAGAINKSDKIVLLKNVVPFLLGNYTTNGWFYPNDLDLAKKLSILGVSWAENKDTFFYAASNLYDWQVDEMVISNNLLADSYQELGFLDKAIDVHKNLLKSYFWRRSDNTPIGGLNSVVKLEKLFLAQLAKEKKDSARYIDIQNELIDTILIIGDKYNDSTIIDKKWHLSSAEWVLDILRRSLNRNAFYDFTKKIMDRTSSDGYKDMVQLYIALEMLQEGKQVEAMDILTTMKPKEPYRRSLNISDWLSENRIIPDTIIYQYNYF